MNEKSDNQTRMLSAVMFSDMVGYTALMQENENRAKELRNRYRKVLEENIAKHQGKIVQYYGDKGGTSNNIIKDSKKKSSAEKIIKKLFSWFD